MNAIVGTKKPTKGRPPVDSEAINLRLQRDFITALDNFRRDLPDLPNRPEAIRLILKEHLRDKGYLNE